LGNSFLGCGIKEERACSLEAVIPYPGETEPPRAKPAGGKKVQKKGRKESEEN